MQIYRIISKDGREATLSVTDTKDFPYQQVAKLTRINKMPYYKVEKVDGLGQSLS